MEQDTDQGVAPGALIRSAEPADEPGLVVALTAAYADAAAAIPDLPDIAAGLSADIADNVVWVAEIDGVIVGGLVLILRDDHAMVANVGVAPVASGQGIGAAMMRLAETGAAALGFGELRLATHVSMPEAIAFYERLGWTVAGRAGRKVLMRKGLAP